ncbi:16S rRNA (guanine(966)-N(2))-methyltransferase RsmD [Gleimia hominis]|uniref:16S rRNA (guanine(966)-N(2))-methyltransferase RsmD n=1 Tax=Gleimia hominis TaxID=595468 RepID=UPI000C807707|nr:16S rRNA (guanine(966)-N(2))-methyltransferase RsmD [Gleimia hominis]WIK65211.1 16S rRNA (guanine(966)-N(2))-methyltransferase RsmD [Gleimia hominis]
MTRIIAGTYKGRELAVPTRGTRPTSSRVREALFSRLEAWDELEGARVLDLYAGSGALGLEALSRGAQSAVLVDKAREASRVMSKNIRCLDAPAHAVAQDAYQFACSTKQPAYTLVFIDPPYDYPAQQLARVLDALRSGLEPQALVVVEGSTRSTAPSWPAGYTEESTRKWGETRAWFLTYTGNEGSVEI